MYLIYAPRQKFGLIPPGQVLFSDEVKFFQNVAFCPKFYWWKIHTENGCQDITPRSFRKIRANRKLQTVTIIATGGIGDSMWAMPFAAAIKERYPTCAIIVVTDKKNQAVWKNVPYIIGTIENLHWNVAGVIRKSDDVFDFGGIATILKREMKLDPIEATFKMAELPLPKEKSKCRPKLIITIDEGKAAQKFLETKGANIKNTKLICIGLDASTSNRQWPFTYVKALTKDFDKTGYTVIWIGKTQDYTQRFLDDETKKIDVINLCGETSLRQAMAIIAISDLYIGPNSGLMVIATSLGIPTVGLFGAFNPAIRAKFYERFCAVWGRPKCAPCGEHWTECRLGHPAPCMKLVDPVQVYATAQKLLSKFPRHLLEKMPIE